MSLTDYIKNLLKPKEPEANPKGLSMAELCRKYLPKSEVGFYPEERFERLKTFANFVAYLTDEEMHKYLTGKNYKLSDRKAKAFVRDSRNYRNSMKKSKEQMAEICGVDNTEPLDIKIRKYLNGLSDEEFWKISK